MNKWWLLPLLALSTVAVPSAEEPADAWWAHVVALANDEMKGRDAGSPEHRKAAEYVARQFKAAGLTPGGAADFFQPVPLRIRQLVEEQSKVSLVRPDGTEQPLMLGDEAVITFRSEPAPSAEGSMVFAGFGLQVPEAQYDDLAGLDLKGKVAVVMTGGPADIPGPLSSYYQGLRRGNLRRAGAVAVLAIRNPKGQDIPWDRYKLGRLTPEMAVARTNGGQAVLETTVNINPDVAEKLFAGSGRSFAEILALSNEGKQLPRFSLALSARVKAAVSTTNIQSDNVVGVLPGTDPTLRQEFVVLSAHLDHLGVGQPIRGDAIYNGAMDNASGIATLIETARTLAARGGLKRSVAFVAVTAEERGLLGSGYFAAEPTVKGTIVANMNTDMYLPLFPLKSLVVQGLEESDLAGDLRRVAGPMGISVLTDPEPERNAFTRSDQYSFIQAGVPALSLKVGFTRDSPEHEIIKRWRNERYHAPSDDLNQPVDKQAAVDFGRVYQAVVAEVANRPTRPQWNADSFFRRFAR